MAKLVVAKFGGSAIGADGISIPLIINRINDLKKHSKVIAVFSAPLTVVDGQTRSLTDVILEQGQNAQNGSSVSLNVVESCYEKILEMTNHENKENCKTLINSSLEIAKKALDEASLKKEFADEIRSKALAFSGEILMAQVMKFVLMSNGIASETVSYEKWPIITDNNIESTNFLASAGFSDQVQDVVNIHISHLVRADQSSTVLYKIEKAVPNNAAALIGTAVSASAHG